jgi:hypothetical protein
MAIKKLTGLIPVISMTMEAMMKLKPIAISEIVK